MLTIEEVELLCMCIEGGLSTSTKAFIQELIDKFKTNKDVRHKSLVKRLENIKKELTK